ncbi:MAG TPA: hypothetical protein DD635_07740 [Flavobacteriales bacterium]|nr:hypothetical protein [Flavobacteriales bacterium]
MRNVIISYRKLPCNVLDLLHAKYPDGFECDAFEFQIPGKKFPCTAICVSIEGVNYFVKLE